MRKDLSKEKINDLYFNQNIPIKKIGILLGCSQNAISKRLDRVIKKNYTIKDKDYFEKIDSEDKAYFLGLIYADGSLNDKLQTLQINLVESDSYILQKLVDKLYNNRELRTIKPKQSTHQVQKQINVTNKKLYEDLKNYGLTQNKSYNGDWIDIKLIPKNLVHHFIRGYFDGDGCIYVNKKTKQRFVNITGTRLFIEGLRKLLVEYMVIYKGHVQTCNNCSVLSSTLSFGGNKQVNKFKEFLYKEAKTFLIRKNMKFTEM